MLDVYISGKRVRLDPKKSIGKGGEADVFALDSARALKVFKTPDHPDYQGLPHEQQAAEARIAVHQHKLRQFPGGLPGAVVAPLELATDRGGRNLVGYTMALVPGAEPLLRYSDPAFRRAGATAAAVVAIFRQLHAAVRAVHAAGVVIGDFNDLNVLVTAAGDVRLIDADSFQYGRFVCTAYTERFVDPLLCDASAGAPRLARPYQASADWYAFCALLMQSLLFVGPYGGIYRPRAGATRVAHAARPLHRITVFHPEVQYPRPAQHLRSLPDELCHHLERVFAHDERAPFPLPLLEGLDFSSCPRCGCEHARPLCPVCVAARVVPVQVVQVRGQARVTPVFETAGVIVHAAVVGGRPRWVYHEAGAYRREDGAVLLRQELDASLQFGIAGDKTVVARGRELVVLGGRDAGVERRAVDGDGAGAPAFFASGKHHYFCAAGRLCRDDDTFTGGGELCLGDVLADQTRIWVGPAFGLGLYRAAGLSVAFLFDAARRGINDSVRLPALRGQLCDAFCTLDEKRAWLFLALHAGGRTHHLCLIYARSGALEGTAEAVAGDGSWLGHLRGKVAVGGVLLGATDAGVVRIEVDAGSAQVTRDFPDTEVFVHQGSQLLAGADGLYVVERNRIAALRIG